PRTFYLADGSPRVSKGANTSRSVFAHSLTVVFLPSLADCSLLFDDVAFQARDRCQNFVSFRFGNFEFIERFVQKLDGFGPIRLVDAETFVNGLHIAPDV